MIRLTFSRVLKNVKTVDLYLWILSTISIALNLSREGREDTCPKNKFINFVLPRGVLLITGKPEQVRAASLPIGMLYSTSDAATFHQCLAEAAFQSSRIY